MVQLIADSQPARRQLTGSKTVPASTILGRCTTVTWGSDGPHTLLR
jgi:hypothetical protein